MDCRKSRRLFRLVRLEMPDEVPARAGQIPGLRHLLFGFLNLVLSEISLSRVPGSADVTGIECLRHGDERDGRRIPARAARGVGYAGSDRREVLRDRVMWEHSVLATSVQRDDVAPH